MATKKKRVRYKINWDAVKDALPNNLKKGNKKHRRKLKKSVIYIGICVIALIVGIIFVPNTIQNNKLSNLGYTSDEIKHIKSLNLTNKIIDNNYYSEYLAEEIVKDKVNEDYLNLYSVVDSKRGLTDTDFLLYGRLQDVGYEVDQIENLFKNLTTEECIPLLVVDYQWNEDEYIKDVINNRNGDVFVSNSYYTIYKLNYKTNTSDSSMLVNPSYCLDSTWAPENVVELSTDSSLTGVMLENEAAEAFYNFCKASETANAKFYAYDGYRTYEDQNTTYQNAITSYGEDNASSYAAPAGYSEHETGLAVNVASTYEPNIAFNETSAYKWAIENCYSYGFIPRYQEKKEYVTGMQFEPSHFRYVGIDIANAVKASNLTYDEFYCLYLKDWDEEKYKPSKKIIESTSWEKLVSNN